MSYTFTKEELNIIRQWFNAVQDLNAKFLEKDDYILAKNIHLALQARVPRSISDETDGDNAYRIKATWQANNLHR